MTIVRPSPGPIEAGETTGTPGDLERGPIWRIVGGSLAVGLVGALLLTLVVFAGAPEHVISGVALLAFAFGWAMLAVLSTRYTSQPQRWALVPAAFMAGVGVALLALAPGDGSLNAVGWVWPAAVLGLAVWMFIQMRRALRGRVRWLLYPVIGLLVVGSVGGTYERVSLARNQNTYAMPGRLYEVGGHRLHLNCTGSGSPTVVLENGLGEMSPFWSRIAPRVAATTRVCAYDRAGQAWSSDAGGPQDGLAVATDLHTLLARAHETGPYVLVGHSVGGSYVMIYAARYPDQVAGMVLLDSSSPYQFTVLPDYASQYALSRRVLAVLPSLARLGLAQLQPSSALSSLPEPAASQVRAFSTSPRHMRSVRDEWSVLRKVFDQAQDLTSLDGKPLVVVTATESQQKTKGWSAAQDRLAGLSSNSQHRIVEATHMGLLDDEHSFEPSVRAIDDVLQSIRSGTPVVTR